MIMLFVLVVGDVALDEFVSSYKPVGTTPS